jgi:hypothetical protein
MQKIFISYSRKDMAFVRKLAGDLKISGYEVWWDILGLQGGDDWVTAIAQAISSSQYVIVVITPSSVKSEWVREEYTQARALHKKIIPIMLKPCSLPFGLNTINFVNFSTGKYADNFNKLLPPLGYTGKPPIVTPYIKAPFFKLTLKYGIPVFVVLILLLAFIFFPRNTPPIGMLTVVPSPTLTASQTVLLDSAAKATEIVSPTIMPTSIPTEIIITYNGGRTTIHSCPSSVEPAMLSTSDNVDLELSATMVEEDLENLEWWTFVSTSKEKFGIGKTASYSPTNEGGIIYVMLNNSIICTLNIR